MTTATYSRYSSDAQRESSLDDQQRNCEAWAARNGVAIARHYADAAISGSTTARPQYQQMLAEARAGRITLLLVDSLDRISRDQEELGGTIKRLEYAGVRIVAVGGEYDTASPKQSRKVQRTIKGLMGELYLDDLADKTHRGLKGVALTGNSAGGKSYGYTSQPIEHPTQLDQFGRPVVMGARKCIHPQQADTVRYIFTRFAAGASTLDITNELNASGVPSPRGGAWARSAIYGDDKRGTGILSNPLYIGQYTWNKSQWIKEPGTGKRKRIERPASEWVTSHDETLRIIDDLTWQRVKQRQQAQAYRTREIQQAHGNPKARDGRGPKYLFSGMLKCGDCGSNFTMVNKFSYGCARHKDRGNHACSNAQLVPRAVVEETLLRSIKDQLYTKQNMQLFMAEVRRLLAEQNTAPQLADIKKQLASAQQKHHNIMAAIEAGIFTPSTRQALETAEADINHHQQQIAGHSDAQQKITALLPDLQRLYTQMIENMATTNDVPAMREQIKGLVGNEITLHQAENKEGKYLEAEIQTAPEAMLRMVSGGNVQLCVVAGARFGTYRIPLLRHHN